MTEKKIFSVLDITRYIKGKLEGDFALRNIRVSGEVSNCKEDKNGHLYFTIKDSAAIMNCAMWASKRRSGLEFKMETGQHIVVTGNVGVYERWGDYRLYADRIEQEGMGKLFEELEKLKQKLKAEGLFDEAHKKPIPKYPKKIGIITSRTGAVIEDIKRTAREANAYVQLILYPAIVQGKEAVAALIRGIERFEEEGVDTIIIGRGGGSIEDLWCFNDEGLARKVYNCSIPIISAVGHQTDRTLVDEVSDLSVATPTAAAMSAVPKLEGTFKELDAYKDRLTVNLQQKIDRMKTWLANTELVIKRQSPQMKLKEIGRQLDSYSVNFNRNITNRLDNYDRQLLSGKQLLNRLMRASYESANKKFISLAAGIEGNSPMKRLLGGYSYVENEAGENVRSIGMVKKGESLKLVLSDGSIKAKVEEIDKKNG
ncbi:MAG: exodeoxyribonuclease VII large subunit [Catonella sp.]